jgi:hypothetical protein
MVSLFWIEGTISDRLLILLNGTKTNSPSYYSPLRAASSKAGRQCIHIPFG